MDSKIVRVIIVREDCTMTVEGKEAEKWESNSIAVSQFASLSGHNAFENHPVKWEIEPIGETIEDGFGGAWSKTCPECGKNEMAVVRPGKVQCNACG